MCKKLLESDTYVMFLLAHLSKCIFDILFFSMSREFDTYRSSQVSDYIPRIQSFHEVTG